MKTLKSTMTKSELAEVLTANRRKRTLSQNLRDQIKYTLDAFKKDEKSVTKKDLFDVAKDIMKSLEPVEPVPVEASVKPKLKKKATPKAEPTTAEEKPAKKKPVKKAPAKKSPAKKKEPVDELIHTKEAWEEVFPKVLEDDELGKMVRCEKKYTTLKAIQKALDDDVALIVAVHWTKSQIKDFSYNAIHGTTGVKSFPHDLDTCQILTTCDLMPKLYMMSTGTEAMQELSESELKPMKTGDGVTMRVSNNAEFEIYAIEE